MEALAGGEVHLAEVHSAAVALAVALEVGPSVEEVPREDGNSVPFLNSLWCSTFYNSKNWN